MQNFDHDAPPEPRVDGDENARHSAAPKLALERVRPTQRCLKPRAELRVRPGALYLHLAHPWCPLREDRSGAESRTGRPRGIQIIWQTARRPERGDCISRRPFDTRALA